MATEWLLKKKPSVLGLVSGAVSGLVVVTPGCGYVDQTVQHTHATHTSTHTCNTHINTHTCGYVDQTVFYL